MTQTKLLKHLFSNLICFSVSGTPTYTTRKDSSLHTLPQMRRYQQPAFVCGNLCVCVLLSQTWIDAHLNSTPHTNNFKMYMRAGCTL